MVGGKLDARIIRAENPFALVHQSLFAKIAFVGGAAKTPVDRPNQDYGL